MRRLMYITIGFALVCAAWIYLPVGWGQWAVIGMGTVLFSRMGKDSSFCFRLLCVSLGCAAALVWCGKYEQLYLCDAEKMDGVRDALSIRVSDYSEETQYGATVTGMVEIGGKPYRVKVYLDSEIKTEPGDILEGQFLLRSTTEKSEKPNRYQQGDGIFLLAYQRGEMEKSQTELGWLDHVAVLRRQLKVMIAASFPEDTFGFAKALLLGDTSNLTYAVDTDLKVSGIRHVIAVSGLHISILFTLLGILTFNKRFLKAVVGIPLLVGFAALTGFSPSVCRACLMMGLMLLAGLMDQEYDGPTALSFAVLVMLVVNPMMASSVSFQLSVASIAGIYLFYPGIRGWMLSLFENVNGKTVRGREILWFCSSAAVSLSAAALTTPLSAFHFGMVSLVAVFTNLLTLWAIGFIFYGIMGVCALHWLLPTVSKLLAEVISALIRYVLWVTKLFGEFSLAAVYTGNVYITIWLIFLYVLLAVYLLQRKKEPVTLLCSAVLGLSIALLATWGDNSREEVRFTMLDVGQGQSLLLQAEGRSFLVDCGGDSDTKAADLAAEVLLGQGINRLDGLILTHLDRDHAGGADYLMSRIDTSLLILPPVSSEIGENRGAEIIYADRDIVIQLDELTIHVYASYFPQNSNENSLCVLFDTEKCDILITGDRSDFGERSLLRNAQIPDVDILVAGHHGAEDSTCEELLNAVNPEIVMISAGLDNAYGHPAPGLLQRLEEHGCAVYRTDLQGTITIRR